MLKYFVTIIVASLFSCVGGPEAPGAVETRDPQSRMLSKPEADECTQDSDCVPATCCHATWCAPAGQGPACMDVGCQAVELPQTLDGSGAVEGGGCRCVEGRCGARLNDGCLIIGPQPPAQAASERDTS